jgi:hypothetical protein
MIEYQVKGNYGEGWEVVTTEDTMTEARKRYVEYRENEPEYRHKITKHRTAAKQNIWPKFGGAGGSGE